MLDRVRSVPRWLQVVLGMAIAAAVVVPSAKLYASWRRAAVARERDDAEACEPLASVQLASAVEPSGLDSCESAFVRSGNYHYLRLRQQAEQLVESSKDDAKKFQLAVMRLLSPPVTRSSDWFTSYDLYDQARGNLGDLIDGHLKELAAVNVSYARGHLAIAMMGHLALFDRVQVIVDFVLLSSIEAAEAHYGVAFGWVEFAFELTSSMRVVVGSRLATNLAFAQERIFTDVGAFGAAADVMDKLGSASRYECDQMFSSFRKAVVQYNQGDVRAAARAVTVATALNQRCPKSVRQLVVTAAQVEWKERPRETLESLKQLHGDEKEDPAVLITCGQMAALFHRWNDAERFLRAANVAAKREADDDWPQQAALATGQVFEYMNQVESGADTLSVHGGPVDFSACEEGAELILAPTHGRDPLDSEKQLDVAGCYDPDEVQPAVDAKMLIAAERYYCRAIRYIKKSIERNPGYAEFRWATFRLGTARLIRLRLQQQRVRDAVRAVALWTMGSMPDPLADPPSSDQLIAAWRGRDLVILIAPEPSDFDRERGEVYRLRIKDGEASGEILESGELESDDPLHQSVARHAAIQLISDAANQDAGKSLGSLLIPRGDNGLPLNVMALGRLSALPLAALRDDDGELVQKRRPLGRVLGLYASTLSTPASDKLVVLADPDRSLLMAMAEGPMVRGLLGPHATLYEGDRVTEAAFADAAKSDLLHIAGHATLVGLDAGLSLVSGRITAKQLEKARVSPRIAVIAACGSAAVNDEGAWRTVASAMLRYGSQYVIATDRPVSDVDSMFMMNRLYQQSSLRTDPVAAMARAQVEVSERSAIDPQQWAAFSVLVRPPVIPTAQGRN